MTKPTIALDKAKDALLKYWHLLIDVPKSADKECSNIFMFATLFFVVLFVSFFVCSAFFFQSNKQIS